MFPNAHPTKHQGISSTIYNVTIWKIIISICFYSLSGYHWSSVFACALFHILIFRTQYALKTMHLVSRVFFHLFFFYLIYQKCRHMSIVDGRVQRVIDHPTGRIKTANDFQKSLRTFEAFFVNNNNHNYLRKIIIKYV